MADDVAATPPRRRIPQWMLPLLIGVVTITAGVVTWRAGQLGSSAAYQDRQAVGQTIQQQERFVEARLGAAVHARDYVSYVASFAEASALETIADAGPASGEGGETLRAQAQDLRDLAWDLAVSQGVFTEQQRLNQVATAPAEPLPFDLQATVAQLQAEVSIGFASPGTLDPDSWADQANDTRHRVRQLRMAALGLMAIVLTFTVAQLTERRTLRRLGAGTGSVAFVVIIALTASGPY